MTREDAVNQGWEGSNTGGWRVKFDWSKALNNVHLTGRVGDDSHFSSEKDHHYQNNSGEYIHDPRGNINTYGGTESCSDAPSVMKSRGQPLPL